MNSSREQLRLNGYSAHRDGVIECRRGGVGGRWAHERTGILKIEVSRDSKDTRALVDAAIAAIDEPRALCGRDRRGGAVMLFRVDVLGINGSRSNLALRTGEDIVITFGSDDLSVDLGAYTWPRGRSPLEVPREALPPLYPDHLAAATSAAQTAGAQPAEAWERERKVEARIAAFKADLAAGRVTIKTDAELDAERQLRADEETVKAYEGREVFETDGNAARLVLAARARFAAWLSRKASAA